MTCVKRLLICAFVMLLTACPGTQTETVIVSCNNATISPASSLITSTNTNSIPVYVADQSTTGAVGYANEPLVSVTICSPNHTLPSQCTTISNILLDTGSFGLRVFATAFGAGPQLQPQMITVAGQPFQVGECQLFGTGADWGSVQMADVVLGNQTAQNISIQVINDGAVPLPQVCADQSPDSDPCSAGYNGILGVGMFAEDCGSDCASSDVNVNNGQYFACFSGGCFDTYNGNSQAVAVPTNQQVVNPLTHFGAGFKNGLSLSFPFVNASGNSGVVGALTIGIGVTAGNVPPNSANVYNADPNGMTDGEISTFQTVFNATTYGYGHIGKSFLDSGSNGLFFPSPGAALPACSDVPDFFCPTSTQPYTAIIKDYTGTTSSPAVSFHISDADTLISSQQSALPNLGGNLGTTFDWGLPFFYNNTTWVGFDGQSATFNGNPAVGPYWAF